MALVHRLSAAHAFDTCVRDNGRSWWAALGGLQLSPTEPFGGSSLRGRDRLVFAMAALDRGYSDRRWVMAGSFKAHGFMVARGERPIALGVGDGQRIVFNAEQAYAACGQGIRYGGPLETQDGERSDGREDVVYDPTLGIVLVPSDPDGLARRMA